MKLSRRDRAAMVLAYECLRSTRGTIASVVDAEDALLACRDARAAWDIANALRRVESAEEPWAFSVRVERARLALLLRVLLRADAGDFGPLRVVPGPAPECLDAMHHVDIAGRCGVPGCSLRLFRRYTPLWEQCAPAAGGGG